MNKLLLKTKRGGASMFIVMFTVIVLSIITLSFTRLIISEATKTSNTDLSQSAYDSALAGVEDAKIALLRYHACLDKGYRRGSPTSTNECERMIYYMQKGIEDQDCSTVQRVLSREKATDTHGVVVQETQNSSQEGNNTSMLQAYTCVTIQETLADYRTTLDSSSRLRIIPLRSGSIDSIDTVVLSWFSNVNQKQLINTGSNLAYCSDSYWTDQGRSTLKVYPLGRCTSSNTQQAPTTLTARLIQTDENFDLSQLSVSKTSTRTDVGQLTFVPSESSGETTIAASAWGESANKAENQLTKVKCKPVSSHPEWFCSTTLKLPNTWNNSTNRSDANTYLLVSIPYGSPETDVSVELLSNNGSKHHDFTGVQARIDSTGRANDLYRRVETRVELVDTYFAYPEFEVTMTGGSNSKIEKSFRAAFNCWVALSGVRHECADTKASSTYSTM